MRLRLVLGPSRSGGAAPFYATVEWAGQVGHPSSYALLTGTRSSTPNIKIHDTGAKHRSALAAGSDKVFFGLPTEYEGAVADVLNQELQPVSVGGAAHGLVGSSEVAFRGVSRLLCRILAGELPFEDEAVWHLLDRCWEGG